MALGILLEHMHKKFEINQTKIKAGCQSGRKVVTHNSKSDLPLHSCHVIQSQSVCKKAKERERERASEKLCVVALVTKQQFKAFSYT